MEVFHEERIEAFAPDQDVLPEQVRALWDRFQAAATDRKV
jgi:hypothetical protein